MKKRILLKMLTSLFPTRAIRAPVSVVRFRVFRPENWNILFLSKKKLCMPVIWRPAHKADKIPCRCSDRDSTFERETRWIRRSGKNLSNQNIFNNLIFHAFSDHNQIAFLYKKKSAFLQGRYYLSRIQGKYFLSHINNKNNFSKSTNILK